MIAEVATSVDPTGKATALALTTTQGSAFYVSTNADQNTGGGGNDGGGIAALVDNNEGTYFHTRWGGTVVNEPHYIQVDLGAANLMDEFKFTYKPRNGSPAPTAMTVYGSNDGVTFTDVLATINSGLPAHNSGSTYESAAIDSKRYRYLRFTVTGSSGPGNAQYGGQYFFGMLEFDLFKLSSSAEVKNTYKNLAGVTATEVEGVYDSMAAALYYYNNGGTAEQLQDAYDVLEHLYTELNAKKDKLFNGVYNIYFSGDPVFVAYAEANKLNGLTGGNIAGFRLFDGAVTHEGAADGNTGVQKEFHESVIANRAVADALFTIVPNTDATGYILSAQGQYMQTTAVHAQWSIQAFDADETKAGVYLFETAESADIYKLRSNKEDGLQYVNDWGPVFGNNSASDTYARFSLTPITEYTLHVPANGVTTLCLPFNVVLPEGVIAYDLANDNITKANRYSTYELVTVATAGETIAANTPVIIKAAADDYTLTITMDGEGAKASVENSVLRSGLVKTTVAAGNNYTFDGVDFNLVAAGTEIAANQCWMELDENLGAKIYGTAPDYVLTTDEENPALYKIVIKRANDNSKVLSYDEPTSEKVKIVDNAANSSYQAWYFVQGENGIIIKPYNADGRMLTVESTGDGAGKAMIAADGASNFQEWSFTKSTQSGCTDYYYIKVVGGEGNAGTFSHNGGFGVTSYMGIWSGGFNTADGGSLFKFVEAEFENDNARYYQLKDVADAMSGATYYTGESVGLYSTDGIEALDAKCDEAQQFSNTSEADACYAKYQEIRAAKVDAYNAPAADKVYYIVSTATGDGHAYCTGKYVHTYSEPHLHQNATWGDKTYDQRHLLFDADGDISQLSLAAFQFEEAGAQGSYKMKNLHTGLYVKSFNNNVEHMGTATDAAVVKIAGIADGQVTLKIGNNNPMHAQNDYSVIVTWTAAANNPSTWTINEVEDMSELYSLNVPASGVATLNLAFNVVLPQGVTAYDYVESDISGNEFTLTQVAAAGDVLAKNTPVIIKAAEAEYPLTVTMSDENVVGGTANSVLRGNYWQTTVGTAELNYLPGVDGERLAFNKVTADDTVVAANTVWAVMTNDQGETIYELEVAPEVEIVVGGVYRIRNYTSRTADAYKTHYIANTNANITFPVSVEADDNSAMWVCTGINDGKYKFASALGTAAFGWRCADEEAVEYAISDGVVDGAKTLTYVDGSGTSMNLALTTEGHNNSGVAAFNQASNNNGFNITQAENWSTDWYFEEVENPSISFVKSINKGNKWATMYLPYAVAIPDGVDVFYAVENAINNNVIDLTSIAGTIPAKTAVLLYRGENTAEAASFEFALAEDVEAVASNLFEGKIMQTAIDATDARVYLLVNYNAEEKFYWMAAEYNANCQLSNEGGYVKCDANKCYLKLPEQQATSSYSFRYEGSTAIEEVEGEDGEIKAIYDLQGRKLTEVTEPGFYIVDGEKVWMK